METLTTTNLITEAKQLAKVVSEKAYCPYSHFPVGAVVVLEDGSMYTGCNVENAAFGSTICAERCAILKAISEIGTPLNIQSVVIYTPTPMPSAPCGSCRQVINEFSPNAMLYSFCDGPEVLQKPMYELLPDAFGPQNL